MPQIEIGFLIAATQAAWKKYIQAFETALNTPNVNINYKDANADPTQYPVLAGQLAGIPNIKAIVTAGTEAALACKNATAKTNIAVIFASAGDPVACGLVPSLTSPGGNVTGCSNMQTDDSTVQTRVGVMKNKLAPQKVGVIGNNPPGSPVCPIDQAMDKALYWLNKAGIATASKNLGQWAPSDFQSVPSVLAKLAPLKADKVDILLVCSDPVVSANVDNLTDAAHNPHMKLKTMHEFREHVDPPHHGDQCYGPNFQGLFRQAAGLVDQILQTGVAPGTIDVYEPPPGTYDEVP